MVLFTWRWMPHFQHLHDLVAGGYIGRWYEAHFDYRSGYARAPEYAWRFDRRRANGCLGDLGSHMIDFARWTVGDIVKVSAHLATFVDRPGADGLPPDPANDSAILAVEFANGAHGTIQVSAVALNGDRGVEKRISLQGAAGSLEAEVVYWGVESGAVLRGAQREGDPFQTLAVPDRLWEGVDRSDFVSSMVPGLFLKQSIGPRLFIDAILEDRPVSPSFYDGSKAQQVVDAALESHATGRQVSIGGSETTRG